MQRMTAGALYQYSSSFGQMSRLY